MRGKSDVEVIDATCTWVLQSQKAARELAAAGYTVCIIGHEDHPEVKGVRSYAGDNHVVVDDMDRSTWERVPQTKRIGVLSQSTILPFKLEEFAAFCLRRCHDLRVVNTVCPVTLTRQSDSVVLASGVDAMIVVGGKNSSNTKELAVKCAEVCADRGIPLALLGSDGNVYLPISTAMPGDAQNGRLKPFAEQRVRVTGRVVNQNGARAIFIDTIARAS